MSRLLPGLTLLVGLAVITVGALVAWGVGAGLICGGVAVLLAGWLLLDGDSKGDGGGAG